MALTLVVPKECYQRASGLRSLSRSAISIGSPLVITALYGVAGIQAAIVFDLTTFAVVFLVLALAIHLPQALVMDGRGAGILDLAAESLRFLVYHPLVQDVFVFMAGVNLVASASDAVLPALVIPNPKGGNGALGLVSTCTGVTMVAGSALVTLMPRPKDRVWVIYLTILFSFGIESFLLAFSREPLVWCVAQVIGWMMAPVMGANQDVIMRSSIPVELQGRVFTNKNTLLFDSHRPSAWGLCGGCPPLALHGGTCQE